MQSFNFLTRAGFSAAVLASCWMPSVVIGQEVAGTDSQATFNKPTIEPIHRVRVADAMPGTNPRLGSTRIKPDLSETPFSKPKPPTVVPKPAPDAKRALPVTPIAAAHPLDRALLFADSALASMRSNVTDYTARMAKRERIKGVLSKTSFMDLKIRCPRVDAQGQQVPFSIYMKFLQPRDASGREVLWVDGRDDGNLLAHQPGGIVGMRTFELSPTGMMAMQGQRYPIYEAGLENLIVKLIEKASRDKAAGMCEVTYRDGLKLKNRPCSLIELVHKEKRAPYEFYKAQVVIDDELNLPVRYTAYDWPKTPGAKPEILEQYTYINIKLNVGLTDKDFDPKNSAYTFPGR